MICRDRDRGVLVVNVPLRLLTSLLMAVPLALLGDASLSVSPTSVHPGAKGVQIDGQGFQDCPGGLTRIYLDYPETLAGQPIDLLVPGDGYGRIHASIDIPVNTAPGEYTFAADCAQEVPNFAVVRADLVVTPAPPPSTTTTPTTRPPTVPPTRPTTRPTVVPTDIRPTFAPGGTAVPPIPTSTPSVAQPSTEGPDPASLVGLLGVVAALVAGTVLVRRLPRGRERPGEAPKPPVIHAVARPPELGPTDLSTGPVPAPAIRVLVRSEPGVTSVRRSGGEWSE